MSCCGVACCWVCGVCCALGACGDGVLGASTCIDCGVGWPHRKADAKAALSFVAGTSTWRVGVDSFCADGSLVAGSSAAVALSLPLEESCTGAGGGGLDGRSGETGPADIGATL